MKIPRYFGWFLAAMTAIVGGAQQARAHTLTFTPTASIGTSFWAGSPIVIGFSELPAHLSEFQPGGQTQGVNLGITSYSDDLISISTIDSNGLLVLPGFPIRAHFGYRPKWRRSEHRSNPVDICPG